MPPPSSPRTPWEYIDAFPPPYCRLFGKKPGGGTADMAFTDSEVAIRSGMSLTRVREISRMESMDSVPLGEMRRFFDALNFDPTTSESRTRVTKYEKICQKRKCLPFRYLRRSPKWETEFLPLLLLANRILRSKGEGEAMHGAAVTPETK